MNILNTTIKVLSTKTMILLILMLFTQLDNVRAQGNYSSSTIVGTWSVDVGACMASIGPEDKELMSTSPDLSQKVQQSLFNRSMTFNPDGTFGQMDGFGNQMTGIWQIQGNTLTITSSNNKVWVQQIVQQTPIRITLKQFAKGEAQPVIPVLFLIKS
ncbi:lipocalin family protein [Flagellimonas sp.]|uniref:lipocalin family protein n=1 Tax=Flagellimonas sp. TaxID=2058762 RepID=UPI003BAA3759